jgi:two-component system, LytTR family, response regulator
VSARLRVVVADDERPARSFLVSLLRSFDDVAVVGEAASGKDAVAIIEKERPDLALLDWQMPELNGIGVVRMLKKEAMPLVAFVTAYDEYAVRAFEVNAVDYLLKPVDPERLGLAVQRAQRRVSSDRTLGVGDPISEQLEKIVQLVADRQNRRERLAIKVGERFMLVQAEEIVYASLADEAITVVTSQHVGTSNYRTLDELQARLDPGVFWRVHRSHLVNINKIKEIVPWFSRNYILRMKDDKSTEIPVSRTQTRRLREYLKI